MSLELTDEEICAARIERDHAEKQGSPFDLCLISALFKLQAGKMKAEFYTKHDFLEIPMLCCDCCLVLDKDDPRHTWKDEQWLEAAKASFKEADTEEQ